MLKSFFRKFLPVPTNAFYRKINELENSLKVQSELLNKVLKSQSDLSNEVISNRKIFQSELGRYNNFINAQTICWDNKFEREIVQANWGIVMDQDNFGTQYLNLIHGLDPNSIEIVTRIILRQKRYLSSDSSKIDLFTREEQDELRTLNEKFFSEIIKLADDLFAFKHYLLPIKHFEASVFFYRHGIDEIETISTIQDKAIIDVGGYIGDSALIFSELPHAKTYTFEAVPENYLLLQKTIELNKLTDIVAENIALGAKQGTLVMHQGTTKSWSTAITRHGLEYSRDILVAETTLDHYVETHKINVGLIKVDIEGGEPGFLTGAEQTIKSQRPILLISIYHNASDFFTIKPMIEKWNVGYSFKIYKPTISNISSETLLIAQIK